MEVPTKKLINGFTIPVLGLGTYGMGGRTQREPDNDDERDIEAIKNAIEKGIYHIDTAELYADGYAEILIGKAISSFEREDLFVTSKVKRSNLNYRGIKQSVKESLVRLRTDYLDLYLLHRYPEEGYLKECVLAMNELVEDGVIRNIGISNFNLEHTKMACELSKAPIAATQVHYNLQFREPEVTGLLRYCQENDIMLVAYRPVNQAVFNKSGIDLTKGGINFLDKMCEKYHGTPAQVSINWLISQKNVVTVVKTSDPVHLDEDLGSLKWHMDKSDVELLRSEFPEIQIISDNQPLK